MWRDVAVSRVSGVRTRFTRLLLIRRSPQTSVGSSISYLWNKLLPSSSSSIFLRFFLCLPSFFLPSSFLFLFFLCPSFFLLPFSFPSSYAFLLLYSSSYVLPLSLFLPSFFLLPLLSTFLFLFLHPSFVLLSSFFLPSFFFLFPSLLPASFLLLLSFFLPSFLFLFLFISFFLPSASFLLSSCIFFLLLPSSFFLFLFYTPVQILQSSIVGFELFHKNHFYNVIKVFSVQHFGLSFIWNCSFSVFDVRTQVTELLPVFLYIVMNLLNHLCVNLNTLTSPLKCFLCTEVKDKVEVLVLNIRPSEHAELQTNKQWFSSVELWKQLQRWVMEVKYQRAACVSFNRSPTVNALLKWVFEATWGDDRGTKNRRQNYTIWEKSWWFLSNRERTQDDTPACFIFLTHFSDVSHR